MTYDIDLIAQDIFNNTAPKTTHIDLRNCLDSIILYFRQLAHYYVQRQLED